VIYQNDLWQGSKCQLGGRENGCEDSFSTLMVGEKILHGVVRGFFLLNKSHAYMLQMH
jgi:hypothetical protein